MAKGAGYGISIAFVLSIVFGIGSQNGCDFACYTWFLGNTDLHFLLLNLKLQSRNLEVGIEMKSLGVMNGGGIFRLKETVFSRMQSGCILSHFNWQLKPT